MHTKLRREVEKKRQKGRKKRKQKLKWLQREHGGEKKDGEGTERDT